MKSVWQKLCISGNYFCPRQNVISRYWWEVKMSSGGRGLQSEVREIWSQCLSLSQTQCILCDLQGWLLIILASIWGENAALQSHFRGTLITRATHLNWRKIALPPPLLVFSPRVSHRTRLKTEMRNPLCFFGSEKWKFESERWSEASKGTCNWAALDRLSGNMKQQQLWRRVIASLGLYNALSSL